MIMTVSTVFLEPRGYFPAGYATNIRYSIIPLLTAVCIFEFFVNTNVKYNKVINSLANSTFAVLLIHDDPLVRDVLWNKLLKNLSLNGAKRGYFCYQIIAIVLGVYLCCIMIDKIIKGVSDVLRKCLEKKHEQD